MADGAFNRLEGMQKRALAIPESGAGGPDKEAERAAKVGVHEPYSSIAPKKSVLSGFVP